MGRHYVNFDDAGWNYEMGSWLKKTPITVEHVVFDFLEGRRCYERVYGKGQYPGAAHSKALKSVHNRSYKTGAIDSKKKGKAYWMQYHDVGATIAGEILDFLTSKNLQLSHQTGDDLSHMYLNGKREDSEDVDDWGRQKRYANKVAREGEEWGKLVQERKKAEAKAARAAKKAGGGAAAAAAPSKAKKKTKRAVEEDDEEEDDDDEEYDPKEQEGSKKRKK